MRLYELLNKKHLDILKIFQKSLKEAENLQNEFEKNIKLGNIPKDSKSPAEIWLDKFNDIT